MCQHHKFREVLTAYAASGNRLMPITERRCEICGARESDAEHIKIFKNKFSSRYINLQWVREIEDFCDENRITPQDLIEAYKSLGSRKVSPGEQNASHEP